MHDGYLFTLGICGAVSDITPAPAILNSMLAAIPPVKRAALTGAVVSLDASGNMHDPLLAQVVADMLDAELLFFVSPLYRIAASDEAFTVALPGRMKKLLAQAAVLAEAEQLRGKLAVLVGVDTGTGQAEGTQDVTDSALDRIVYKQMMLAPLQRFCVAAGIEVTGAAVVAAPDEPGTLAPDAVDTVTRLAQHAYALARQRVPDALPHST
jgi:hypothetical protein